MSDRWHGWSVQQYGKPANPRSWKLLFCLACLRSHRHCDHGWWVSVRVAVRCVRREGICPQRFVGGPSLPESIIPFLAYLTMEDINDCAVYFAELPDDQEDTHD